MALKQVIAKNENFAFMQFYVIISELCQKEKKLLLLGRALLV